MVRTPILGLGCAGGRGRRGPGRPLRTRLFRPDRPGRVCRAVLADPAARRNFFCITI
jgi:hypothetical protein